MDDSFFSEAYHPRGLSESATIDGKITFSTIPYKSQMIVLMNHPASITVKNHVLIKVLLGSVSVFGYEMNAQSKPLKALSLKNTGLVQIKTESSDCIWEQNTEKLVLELKRKLNTITQNAKRTENLLNKMENCTVVILLRLCVYPTNLQLLEFYFPKLLKSEESSANKHDKTLKSACVESKYSPIQFGLDEEKLISDIHAKIKSSRMSKVDAPRIVVFGSRDTGKSTLIRYLINRILPTTLVAYYLDTDPGQPEFTPPGAVSLNEVSEAIIGPAFFHQKDPISMVFTGDISVSSIDMYSNSVSKLMQLYTEKYTNEPLFVNTMGWIQGLGLECLTNVLKIVNPTIVVELVPEDEISMFDYREYVSQDTVYHMIVSTHGQKSSYPPKAMREFSIISYLGKSLSPYVGAVPVNQIRPCCVSWDKIAMYVCNKGIQPWRLVEALSLSIVALCAVPKSTILVSEKLEFPMTLEEDPENECIGFGLVRAIDEEKHLFYIVTPLELYELKKVNALIKGNIMVPDILLLKQEIEGKPLPYLRDVKIPTSNEVEMEDVSMVSLQDGESSASNFMTAELYGKSVPKRYGRKR